MIPLSFNKKEAVAMIERFSLVGKKALIIGGAGSIGMAIGQGLVECGVTVAIADMVEKLTPEHKEALEGYATLFPMDVTCEESVHACVAQVNDQLGTIDILVNAQGVNYKAMVEDIDIDQWDFVQRVNTRGVVLACKAVIPYMKKQQSGRIISLSSVRSERGDTIGNATYGASKAAINILTKNMALELATSGITVNAIGPTVVMGAQMGRTVEPGHFDGLLCRHPMGRLCDKDDCSALVAFLASDAASYITGHTIYLDGGAMAYM